MRQDGGINATDRQLWSLLATNYDLTYELRPRKQMQREVLGAVRDVDGFVLNAGAGTGYFERKALRAGIRPRIVSVELAEGMICQFVEGMGTGWIIQATLESRLPFRDGTFGGGGRDERRPHAQDSG